MLGWNRERGRCDFLSVTAVAICSFSLDSLLQQLLLVLNLFFNYVHLFLAALLTIFQDLFRD
jgi:hypothetical protein